ncbi:UNVERIFIED_CONTAM: hypothetical protein GTU68_005080, partial [Idotea baltica]|nr:hypothetical protein [Idotea baltica]
VVLVNDGHSKFAISSSRVVTPTGVIEAAIVVEDQLIQDVIDLSQVPADLPVTDYGDFVISPGLIDAHVHINDPGTDWEGFDTATAAAAAGGVTTLIDMPLNSRPVTTTVSALEQKRAAAENKCLVNVEFYGGLVPGNETELLGLLDAGVLGVKAFLCDSGLAEFPAAGERELRGALEILKPRGVPLLAHAEIVSAAAAKEITDPTSYQQYMVSRPPKFELDAIRLLIDLCREFQTPVHIVHLATAEALPMIAAAKREGLQLTVETCPHYLLFNEQQIVDGDTRFKCAPPIRDDANRLALCEAVGSGLIDSIGSDHSPCPPAMKCLESGDFQKAWGGIAGLQLTLPVTRSVGSEFDWQPELLAQRCASGPADIFGLSDVTGRIRPGLNADIVVWDPDGKFTVDTKTLFHRHPVSPYEGVSLHGVTHCTYVRGQLVYDRRQSPALGWSKLT